MDNENNTLSQDEIDALLSITNDDYDEIEDAKDEEIKGENVSNYLSPIEADALGEIGNISIGSSATTLSTLLNNKVSITTPTITIIKKPELYDSFSFEHVHVTVNYVEDLSVKTYSSSKRKMQRLFPILCSVEME